MPGVVVPVVTLQPLRAVEVDHVDAAGVGHAREVRRHLVQQRRVHVVHVIAVRADQVRDGVARLCARPLLCPDGRAGNPRIRRAFPATAGRTEINSSPTCSTVPPPRSRRPRSGKSLRARPRPAGNRRLGSTSAASVAVAPLTSRGSGTGVRYGSGG